MLLFRAQSKGAEHGYRQAGNSLCSRARRAGEKKYRIVTNNYEKAIETEMDSPVESTPMNK